MISFNKVKLEKVNISIKIILLTYKKQPTKLFKILLIVLIQL